MNRPVPSFADFRGAGRKPVSLSQESLVRTRPLDPEGGFGLVVEPNVEGFNLETWAARNRDWVLDRLREHGSVLFTGCGVASPEQFRSVAAAVTPDLLDYKERAAPRREVGAKVYTSTEFPADQEIPLHHEMSYSHNWPRRLWFYCDLPAEGGGATPLTDDRRVIDRIDPEIKAELTARQVMYVRDYGEGVDLPWQEAFQTDDRVVVERYCRESETTFEWRDGNRLRTRAVRPVTARHPETGQVVWFNHAHMFHISNLEPAVRQALLEEFAEDEVPRNAFFGDGAPLDPAMLEAIRDTYRRSSMRFPWRQGDLLLVDNVLASHGRDPFSGPRRILVAMSDLHTIPQVAVAG